nr:hypothetical protein [uncultured Mediterraneibacter sp.]
MQNMDSPGGQNESHKNSRKGIIAAIIIGGIICLTAILAAGVILIQILTAERQIRRQMARNTSEREFYEKEENPLLEQAPLAGYNTFTLEGREITLPMAYEDFEKLGFDISDPEFADTHMVNPDDSAYVSLVEKDGWTTHTFGSAFVYNSGEQPALLRECTVRSIRVYDSGTLNFGPGFHMSSLEREVVRYYGAPDDGYFPEDNPVYRRCRWYAPTYEDNLTDQLEILFEGGVVTEVIISYWGEERNAP